MGKPLPEELLKTLDKIDHPGRLADLIAITLHLALKEQQEIFETVDPLERLKKSFSLLQVERFSPPRPDLILTQYWKRGREASEGSFPSFSRKRTKGRAGRGSLSGRDP